MGGGGRRPVRPPRAVPRASKARAALLPGRPLAKHALCDPTPPVHQGGPIPGNEDFKLLFEATVGRAYKYAYRMDIVNSAAPLPWCARALDGGRGRARDCRGGWGLRREPARERAPCVLLLWCALHAARLAPLPLVVTPPLRPPRRYKRVPASIWINDTFALLQDRPHWDFLDFSWNGAARAALWQRSAA